MPSPATPQPPLRCAACTIISPNYLPFARTLAASYLAHHPGHQFFVLIVASLTSPTPFAAEPFQTCTLHQLNLPNLSNIAFKYDILELNTNVKPTFMRLLLAQHGLDRLVYLDPDISVYSPLTPVFEALEENDAVLTPHITSPINDNLHPDEQDMLYNGTYNLGFIAVSNSPNADAILAWWERRCLDLGFSEGRTGLFVDQKWMNLAPGLFPGVHILRHPGCNMAYWNLHERTLTPDGLVLINHLPLTTNHWPLCFFHFSGIVPSDPTNLSKHTDRFTLATRPDLTDLFADYKSRVLANTGSSLECIRYGYDTLTDGTAVTRLARRLYAAHEQHFLSDPFDATGPFAAFARSTSLVAGKSAPPKATWQEFSGTDRRVEMVHKLLRLALRTLGPNRYELLMRYLAHIAVLRNQSIFIKPKNSD